MAKQRPAIHGGQRRPSQRRAARLYRLLQSLSQGARGRAQLLRHLRVGMRTFYRDLELLRAAGIELTLENGKYSLSGSLKDSLELLPFPDPELSFADVLALGKAASQPGRKLRKLYLKLTR